MRMPHPGRPTRHPPLTAGNGPTSGRLIALPTSTSSGTPRRWPLESALSAQPSLRFPQLAAEPWTLSVLAGFGLAPGGPQTPCRGSPVACSLDLAPPRPLPTARSRQLGSRSGSKPARIHGRPAQPPPLASPLTTAGHGPPGTSTSAARSTACALVVSVLCQVRAVTEADAPPSSGDRWRKNRRRTAEVGVWLPGVACVGAECGTSTGLTVSGDRPWKNVSGDRPRRETSVVTVTARKRSG